MIGYLRGIPKRTDTGLMVLVGGVGYTVFVSNTTLAAAVELPEIELYIFTHVTETAFDLFGFRTQQEKKLFTLLLATSGVGPKTALAITEKGSDSIVTAVQEATVSFFTSVPRVGKKMAQKIIIDLTPKLGSIKELQLAPLSGIHSELSEALLSLGFDENSVTDIARSPEFEGKTIQEALQLSLKKLGSRTA